MKMVNIGCGSTYHTDWVNIDVVPHSINVIGHDIIKGLPFESNTFDVCYSSHILEHLRKEEADLFIREQRRVLKSNGIIRIVIPDLETISRNYLKYLEELVSGDLTHEFRYEYSLLELYDQVTRDKSGGELCKLWASKDIGDLEFVIARHGKEAEKVIKQLQNRENLSKEDTKNFTRKKERFNMFSKLLNRVRYIVAAKTVRVLLGRKGFASFREGIFRNSGEIHRVMYDRYSLKRFLVSHGFVDIQIAQAGESRIPNFNHYQLDMVDAKARKPDSLYVEAILP